MAEQYQINRDCIVHATRRYENYCVQCERPLCPRCVMEHTQGHKLIDFEDVLPKAIESMDNALKELGNSTKALYSSIQSKANQLSESQCPAASALVYSHIRLKEALADAPEVALVKELSELECQPDLVNALKLFNAATKEQTDAAYLCKCQPLPGIQWLQFTEAKESVKQKSKSANQQRANIEGAKVERANSSKMHSKYSIILLGIQIATHESQSEGAKWKLKDSSNAQGASTTNTTTAVSAPTANQQRLTPQNTGGATGGKVVRTILAYKANNLDELSFDSNDLLEVVGSDPDPELSDNWFIARKLGAGTGEKKTGLVAKCFTIDITDEFMSTRNKALTSLQLANEQERQRQILLKQALQRSEDVTKQQDAWIAMLQALDGLPTFAKQPWLPEKVTNNDLLEACVKLLQMPKLEVDLSKLKAHNRRPKPQPPTAVGAPSLSGLLQSVSKKSDYVAKDDKNKSPGLCGVCPLPNSCDALIVSDWYNKSIKEVRAGQQVRTLIALNGNPVELIALPECKSASASKASGQTPYKIVFLESQDNDTRNMSLCLATSISGQRSAAVKEVARVKLEQPSSRGRLGSLCRKSDARLMVASSGFRALELFELGNDRDSNNLTRLPKLALPKVDSEFICFTLAKIGEREIIIACFKDKSMQSFAFNGDSTLDILDKFQMNNYVWQIKWDFTRNMIIVNENHPGDLKEYKVDLQSGKLNDPRTVIPEASGLWILAMCVWEEKGGIAICEYHKDEILLLT